MLKSHLVEKFQALSIPSKAALITSCCCLLTALIVVVANHYESKDLISRSGQLHGESLVRQLARDARNPLVQSDKLSLQAILNRLVESPVIIRGTIYNLENQIVADAGEVRRRAQSISASITFQDTIAGYAVITLNATPLNEQATSSNIRMVILSVLLAVISYFIYLIPARNISSVIKDLTVIAGIPHNQRKNNVNISYKGDDELQKLAQQVLARQSKPTPSMHSSQGTNVCYRAVLAIRLSNLRELRINHSEQGVSALLNNIYQQLDTICKLYDGAVEVNSSSSFVLTFDGTNYDETYPFRAICAGHLALMWAQQNQITVSAGAIMSTDPLPVNPIDGKFHNQVLNERAMQLATAHNKLIAQATIAQHDSVKGRIISSAQIDYTIDIDTIAVEQFAPSYDNLLAGQLRTLVSRD